MTRRGDQDFDVLEVKRRVAERILQAAHGYEQPFEVCRDACNDLLRRGFTDLYTRCTASDCYADCCLLDEQFDAGIAVLTPLIADLQEQLSGSRSDGKRQHASTGISSKLLGKMLADLNAERK